ncbi:unnamed protein product [Vitrella brassicaformis CCMP3155]|uniref:RNA helicase n=3 Tax=Vitrella brassicaformis TaxID=1169539 RepID=A0A0G4ECY1_VITBC|nr:unnamed protein product [Vitrella brassicaformis CCMP3155]|eukprot:CEL93192.1 unnamed protein product [Vitrella brassicaformis CCMP3155]
MVKHKGGGSAARYNATASKPSPADDDIVVFSKGGGKSGGDKKERDVPAKPKPPLPEKRVHEKWPKQLLHEMCQKTKRPNPQYQMRKSPPGQFCIECVLTNPKDREKTERFRPEEAYDDKFDAENCAALLALHHYKSDIPLERLLPERYRPLWLQLIGATQQSQPSGGGPRQEGQPADESKAKGKKGWAKAASAIATGNGAAAAAGAGPPSSASQPSDAAPDPPARPALPAQLTRANKHVSEYTRQQHAAKRDAERKRGARDRETAIYHRESGRARVQMSSTVRQRVRQLLQQLLPGRGDLVQPVLTLPAPQIRSRLAHDPRALAAVRQRLSSFGFDASQVEMAITYVTEGVEDCGAQGRRERLSERALGVAMDACVDFLVMNVAESAVPASFNPHGKSVEVVLAGNEDVELRTSDEDGEDERDGGEDTDLDVPAFLASVASAALPSTQELSLSCDSLLISVLPAASGDQPTPATVHMGLFRSLVGSLGLWGWVEPAVKEWEDRGRQNDVLGLIWSMYRDAVLEAASRISGHNLVDVYVTPGPACPPPEDEPLVLDSMYPESVFTPLPSESDPSPSPLPAEGFPVSDGFHWVVRIPDLHNSSHVLWLHLLSPPHAPYPSTPHLAWVSNRRGLSLDSVSHPESEEALRATGENLRLTVGMLADMAAQLDGQGETAYGEGHGIAMATWLAESAQAVVHEAFPQRGEAYLRDTWRAGVGFMSTDDVGTSTADGEAERRSCHENEPPAANREPAGMDQGQASESREPPREPSSRPGVPLRNELTASIRERVTKGMTTQVTRTAMQRLNTRKRAAEIVTLLEGQRGEAGHGSRVLVLQGETGCGKTTQVPRLLLEEAVTRGSSDALILCTQPRRIAAISVADRVAFETGCDVGDVVGYQVRLQRLAGDQTRLLYCTNGILLRWMTTDRALRGVTHVVLDEVHERSVEIDLLLLLLAKALHLNPQLKVCVMSASLAPDLFVNYFKRCGHSTASLIITGRKFEVTHHHADDIKRMLYGETGDDTPEGAQAEDHAHRDDTWEEPPDAWSETGSGSGTGSSDESASDEQPNRPRGRERPAVPKPTSGKGPATSRDPRQVFGSHNVLGVIRDCVSWVHERHPIEAAVLIFVAGIQDITAVCRHLRAADGGFHVLPCHGSLPPEQMRQVFVPPPKGRRKIVVATNVAETSITIEDVRAVIDSGRQKQMQWDAVRRMASLKETWVSQASAIQRAGRAGRVAEGVCFRLYSREDYRQFDEYEAPELHRLSLENTCLTLKTIFPKVGLSSLLSECLEPPSDISVSAAIGSLKALRALEDLDVDEGGAAERPPNERLTPLGAVMGQLPMDVRLAKMLAFGALFDCLPPLLTIVALMSCEDPFLSPPDRREDANRSRQVFSNNQCDFMTKVRAYSCWVKEHRRGRQEEARFCDAFFISSQRINTIHDLRRNFAIQIAASGLLSSRPHHTRRAASGHDVEGDPEEDDQLADLGLEEPEQDVDTATGGAGEETTRERIAASLVKACVAAGLYPNFAWVKNPPPKYQEGTSGTIRKAPSAKELKFYCRPVDLNPSSKAPSPPPELPLNRVFIHPSSVNFHEGSFHTQWLAYLDLVETTKPFVRTTSSVSVFSLLLMIGARLRIGPAREPPPFLKQSKSYRSFRHLFECTQLLVDEWLQLRCPGVIGVYVRLLKELLQAALQSHFARMLGRTGVPTSGSDGACVACCPAVQRRILDVVEGLVGSEGHRLL